MSDLLEYAIQRFDLLTYVQDHGAELVKTNEWLLLCPMCGKQKLTVHILKKSWHCWVCQSYQVGYDGKRTALHGAGGLLDLIQLLDRCERKQAVELVLSAAFMRPDDLQLVPQVELVLEQMGIKEKQPAIPIPAPLSAKPINGNLPYLQKRGISAEDVELFGLYWCDDGRYANRLVFPVWEEGSHVYFQARAMWEPPSGDKSFRKVLNPPRMPGVAVSNEVLLNLDTARLYPRVVLTEGPVDCVRAGPDAVCCFGKTISGVQIAKLARAGVRALDIMWDGPSQREPQGARLEMIEAARMLQVLFDVRLVFLPWGDPADYEREQLYQFRHQAQRLTETHLRL
jgi:hypothetical protein